MKVNIIIPRCRNTPLGGFLRAQQIITAQFSNFLTPNKVYELKRLVLLQLTNNNYL